MKKLLSPLLLALAGTLSTPAFAGEPGTAYGAVDLGSWSITPNAGGYPDSGALGFALGYRVSPAFDMELGLVAAGKSIIEDPAGSVIYKQSALKGAAVFKAPLSIGFSVYGKLGVALVTGHLTGTGAYFGDYGQATTANLMYGFGAEVELSPQLGLRLQHENLGKSTYTTLDTGVDARTTTVGLTFTF